MYNNPYDYWVARDAAVAAAAPFFTDFEVAVMAGSMFVFFAAPFAFFVS